MRSFNGPLLFLVLAGGALMYQYYWGGDKTLPECGDQPAGPNCVLTSKIRPQSVEAMGLLIGNPGFHAGLTKEDSTRFYGITTNGISYAVLKIAHNEGLYKVQVFEDSLIISFIKSSETTPEFTIQDFGFDGLVDVGRLGGVNSSGDEKSFNEELRLGLEHRRDYQELYEKHFVILANKLGV